MPLTILNLEDNPNDAELNAAIILARWPDCRINHVATGEGYVAALEQGGMDIILSDHSIPRFDGQTALALAREKCPRVPFIFVSGTIGEIRAIDALRNGATDYVIKDNLERLVPAVERALREVAERAEREQAEEAMRQSEHKYRELFESLGDAAFLVETKSGKIIDTNRRAVELLGCARTEIVGKKQEHFVNGQSLVAATGAKVPVSIRDTPLTLYGRSLLLRLCQAA